MPHQSLAGGQGLVQAALLLLDGRQVAEVGGAVRLLVQGAPHGLGGFVQAALVLETQRQVVVQFRRLRALGQRVLVDRDGLVQTPGLAEGLGVLGADVQGLGGGVDRLAVVLQGVLEAALQAIG